MRLGSCGAQALLQLLGQCGRTFLRAATGAVRRAWPPRASRLAYRRCRHRSLCGPGSPTQGMGGWACLCGGLHA